MKATPSRQQHHSISSILIAGSRTAGVEISALNHPCYAALI